MSVCQLKSNYFSLIHTYIPLWFWVSKYFWSVDEAVPDHCWKSEMTLSHVSSNVHPVPSWSEVTSRSAVKPVPHSKQVNFFYFCLWFYLAWINSQIITSVSSADNSKEEVRWDLSHLDGLTIQSQRFSLKKKMLESYICSCSSTHMEDEIMITLLTFWLCGDNGT